MSDLADGQRDGGSACQAQRMVDRSSLRFYVQQAIFCQVTGEVLDVRRAVVLRAEDPAGRAATVVMTGDAWDANKDRILANAAAGALKTDALDGRELHKRLLRSSRSGKRVPVQPPRQSPRASGPVPGM